MAVYFFSSDPMEFTPVGGGDDSGDLIASTMTTAYGDPDLVDYRANMDITGNPWCEHTLDGLKTGTIWMQAYVSQGSQNEDNDPLFELMAGANPVIRLNVDEVQVYDTAAWSSKGDSNIKPISNRNQRIALEVVLHASTGVIRVYKGGVMVAQYTGLDTIGDNGGSGVDTIRFYKPDGSNGADVNLSEMVCANEDIRDMRVFQKQIDANGTNTDWTGDYADIDKLGSDDDLSFIESASAGDVETVGFPNLPAKAASMNVRAVQVSARAREGDTGPTQIQAAVRTGGSNYFGSTQALDTAFGAIDPEIWETNPGTTNPWTQSEIDSLEVGVKSVA